jgi:uncharacterized protein (TIGR02594 family)
MAADDAAVVVTLRASLKDYEAALKSAVRATERAAKASEDAFGNIGKKARPGNVIAVDFQKSFQAASADAKNLGFQINDLFTSIAGGSGVMRALAQQGGQISQIFSGMGIRAIGTTITTALLDPFVLLSLAIPVATVALDAFFSAGEEGGDKAGKELQKQIDLIRQVAKEWGDALPAVAAYADHLQRLADERKKLEAQKILAATPQIAFEDLTTAIVPLVNRLTDLNSAESFAWANKLQDAIEDARKRFANGEDAASAFGNVLKILNAIAGETSGDLKKIGTDGLDELRPKLNATQEAFDAVSGTMQAGFTHAQKYAEAMKILGEMSVKSANDARSAWEMANAVAGTVEEKIAAAAAFQKARQLEIEKEQAGGIPTPTPRVDPFFGPPDPEVERKAKEARDKIQKSITDSIGVAVDAAEQLLGMSETRNAGTINAFLQKGGVDLNAATTAWCAAFVNSALAQVGVKGTGSNVATDFAKWGVKVQPQDVVRGDVLVQQRGRAPGQTGGHVGFATGQMRETADGIKQIEMLSGNAANKVEKDWVNVSSVIARRASESAGFTADQLRHVTEVHKDGIAETIDALNRETQTMQQQGAIYGATIASVDQVAIAKQAHAQVIQIENDLLAQNIELTVAQREQLLASVTANLTASASLKTAQQETARTAQTMKDTQQLIAGMATQAITGFVQDLRNGVDAAEALYNAISRIADQLLQMALQKAFTAILGGFSGGGFVPSPGGGLYASGGYTGDRGRKQIAGVVHGGEYVINAAATQKHRNLLEAINRGVPGYASGGFVLPRVSGPGMAQNASASPPQVNTRTTVVNTFDAGSFLSEALSKPDGVNVILNAVRAQPGAFRQAMQA